MAAVSDKSSIKNISESSRIAASKILPFSPEVFCKKLCCTKASTKVSSEYDKRSDTYRGMTCDPCYVSDYQKGWFKDSQTRSFVFTQRNNRTQNLTLYYLNKLSEEKREVARITVRAKEAKIFRQIKGDDFDEEAFFNDAQQIPLKLE
ncbi:hypothetical protein DBV15_11102 [Temnothorax longispinosus]|uniref:Uncharacterized protein n=1 Tax=Temnothorax longispinosus TaxID=300112 RepID=A0A4S2JAM7_9HYME|nr:hypothetical protein DBV15_11102 [Temnothorax longispinosus]